MKKRLGKALVLLFYILALGLLFKLDWGALFRPVPLISVLGGMLLLTACQYRRHIKIDELLTALRWNLILAAFLTTLMSFLASADLRPDDIGSLNFKRHLLPLLYAGIIYMLLGVLTEDKPSAKQADTANPTATETAEKVFRSLALTRREYHVAHMLLQDKTNKEIAADLYISEATVKKHIQNIYQKSGASDRGSFRVMYFALAKKQTLSDE